MILLLWLFGERLPSLSLCFYSLYLFVQSARHFVIVFDLLSISSSQYFTFYFFACRVIKPPMML